MDGQTQVEMARRRALLTTSERELLENENPDDPSRRYQAVSRIRNKIQDELPRDVELLQDHHQDLLQELFDVVGPIYYCPICGEGFPDVEQAKSHILTTQTKADHPMDIEEFKQWVPGWWDLSEDWDPNES